MVYMEEPGTGVKQGLKSLSPWLSSAVEVHVEPESPSQCPGYALWLPVLSASYKICLRSLDDATGSHNCSCQAWCCPKVSSPSSEPTFSLGSFNIPDQIMIAMLMTSYFCT